MDLAIRARIVRASKEVPILSILDRYNITGKRTGNGVQISCPFHGSDKHPSAHVYESSNKFWCFTCHSLLSVVEFVAQKEEIPVTRAVALLESWYSLPPMVESMEIDIPRVIPGGSVADLLKSIYGMLGSMAPYLTFSEYCRVYVAWQTLRMDTGSGREATVKLYSKLQQICDSRSM